MGIFLDSVEGEHRGHHYCVRTRYSWHFCGVISTFYVDGRRLDERTAYIWRLGAARSLSAMVDGEVVVADVKQAAFWTTYRVFVGEHEVQLHVEPGVSGLSVVIPPPMLPSYSRGQLGP